MRMLSSTWSSQTWLGAGWGLRLVPGAQGDAPTVRSHPEEEGPGDGHPGFLATSMVKQNLPQGTEAPDPVPCSLMPLGREFVRVSPWHCSRNVLLFLFSF